MKRRYSIALIILIIPMAIWSKNSDKCEIHLLRKIINGQNYWCEKLTPEECNKIKNSKVISECIVEEIEEKKTFTNSLKSDKGLSLVLDNLLNTGELNEGKLLGKSVQKRKICDKYSIAFQLLKQCVLRGKDIKIKKKCYKKLDDYTHLINSGAGGDFTPVSSISILEVYEESLKGDK
jgi:hypothetical protein